MKRSARDEETFGLFRSLQVDGKPVAETNYVTASGSLKLTLKASYLNTLKEGKHTARILFADGSVDVTLTILPTPPVIPKTGDTAAPIFWLLMMLLGTAGIAGATLTRKRK